MVKMLKLENKMSLVLSKFINRSLFESRKSRIVRRVSTTQFKLTEDNVEEIKIPVPWGHIAGKWWGNKLLPPVLAIHGWQDNANSFDKLIPLLNLPSVLAIDLPGHGFSSHLTEGKAYDFKEHLITLHRIKKHFNWEQISLLTHSFGAALGFAYAAVFPSEVKWIINFECARTLMTLFRADICSAMSQGIDAFLKIEIQKKKKSPTYTMSEMIKMSIEGSLGSISSPEAALVLLKRGTYLVDNPPYLKNNDKLSEDTDLGDFITYEKQAAMSLTDEEKDNINKIFVTLMESVRKGKKDLKNFHFSGADKYYSFLRDPSIKVLVFQSFDEDFVIEASKSIKCPVLSLRARNGFLYGSTRNLYEKTLDILKTSSKYFEHHDVYGTHHAHLNSPEILAPIINNFIQKRKWWGSKDQQPILCLHGWQDNANTFNTLIPQLSDEFSYLAIDLPGHGFSSHLPKGFFYQTYEVIITLRKIQLYFDWNRVSLIGHSFGAACAFLFSSFFSNEVDFFIAIDTIKPLSKNSEKEIKNGSQAIDKMLLNDSRSLSSAPLYSKDDLLRRWIKGSNNSLTENSCKILMDRGTEINGGLFKLTRDCRIKTNFAFDFSQKENLKLAEAITCSVLFLKAKDVDYFEEKENALDVINIIKRKAKHFEEHLLPGTHHIHLNNPEVVSPVINSFLKAVGGQQLCNL